MVEAAARRCNHRPNSADSKTALDNFLKAAIDAINGVIVVDDAQITTISARKIYGVSPKTVLTIHPRPECVS